MEKKLNEIYISNGKEAIEFMECALDAAVKNGNLPEQCRKMYRDITRIKKDSIEIGVKSDMDKVIIPYPTNLKEVLEGMAEKFQDYIDEWNEYMQDCSEELKDG